MQQRILVSFISSSRSSGNGKAALASLAASAAQGSREASGRRLSFCSRVTQTHTLMPERRSPGEPKPQDRHLNPLGVSTHSSSDPQSLLSSPSMIAQSSLFARVTAASLLSDPRVQLLPLSRSLSLSHSRASDSLAFFAAKHAPASDGNCFTSALDVHQGSWKESH